jgi:hypothetical protein
MSARESRFDGSTRDGWFAVPRSHGMSSPAGSSTDGGSCHYLLADRFLQ